MLACDVAIVRDDALVGDHHSRAGVIPGGGSTQRLPRLVGRQRALGLILAGDHISGTQAAHWGLAYRSTLAERFEEATDELAEQLAGQNPAAQAAIKRLVRDGLELPLADGLKHERDTVTQLLMADGSVHWQAS